MKWFKLAMAAFGVAITVAAAAPQAQATTVTGNTVTFQTGSQFLDASGTGSASTSFNINAPEGKLVDGMFQIDLRNIEYWYSRKWGQSSSDAKLEAAKSWTFTIEHAGTSVNLGGLADASSDAWLKTNAFDGVVAAGEWILTATSDYYKSAKRMIKFDLNGIFDIRMPPMTSSSSSGGSVPVPATAFLILAGLAGVAGARRKRA